LRPGQGGGPWIVDQPIGPGGLDGPRGHRPPAVASSGFAAMARPVIVRSSASGARCRAVRSHHALDSYHRALFGETAWPKGPSLTTAVTETPARAHLVPSASWRLPWHARRLPPPTGARRRR